MRREAGDLGGGPASSPNVIRGQSSAGDDVKATASLAGLDPLERGIVGERPAVVWGIRLMDGPTA